MSANFPKAHVNTMKYYAAEMIEVEQQAINTVMGTEWTPPVDYSYVKPTRLNDAFWALPFIHAMPQVEYNLEFMTNVTMAEGRPHNNWSNIYPLAVVDIGVITIDDRRHMFSVLVFTDVNVDSFDAEQMYTLNPKYVAGDNPAIPYFTTGILMPESVARVMGYRNVRAEPVTSSIPTPHSLADCTTFEFAAKVANASINTSLRLIDHMEEMKKQADALGIGILDMRRVPKETRDMLAQHQWTGVYTEDGDVPVHLGDNLFASPIITPLGVPHMSRDRADLLLPEFGKYGCAHGVLSRGVIAPSQIIRSEVNHPDLHTDHQLLVVVYRVEEGMYKHQSFNEPLILLGSHYEYFRNENEFVMDSLVLIAESLSHAVMTGTETLSTGARLGDIGIIEYD